MFGSWRLAEQDSGQSLLASGASTQGRKKQWRILSFASLDFFSPFFLWLIEKTLLCSQK